MSVVNFKNRITVDDLGFFPDIEKSIVSLDRYGIPIYCSWLTNYYSPSINLNEYKNLKSGLHFNLLEGKSNYGVSSLTDKNGIFCLPWHSFLFPTKQMRIDVKKELDVQLQISRNWFGVLSHIDSHLHLHSIPWIYSLVAEAAKKHKISHVRNSYENPIDDICNWMKPSVFLKLSLLFILAKINCSKEVSCYGLGRVFSLSNKACLQLGSPREIVWHAADIKNNVKLYPYRFIDDKQLQLRTAELRELENYLAAVSLDKIL